MTLTHIQQQTNTTTRSSSTSTTKSAVARLFISFAVFATLLAIVSTRANASMSDINSLSVGQLKQALQALNIDTSDCLYKGDLQEKLRKAHESGVTAPASAAGTGASSSSSSDGEVDLSVPPKVTLKCHADGALVQYEDSPLLMGNTKNPTALVTLTHGLGDSAAGWKSAAQMLAPQLPHVLFMLPTAPRQAVTVNGGMKMNAWFDILSLGGSAAELAARKSDVVGVLTSAKYISHMAGHIAHKHNIPTNRIVFGGFSQGAGISVSAALTAPYVPAGVMALSGFFPAHAEALAAAKASSQLEKLISNKVPFKFFHGDADPILPVGLAKLSVDALKAAGITGTELKVYPNMAHSTCQAEMMEAVAYLKELTA